MGFTVRGGDTPIIPVIIGDAKQRFQPLRCWRKGNLRPGPPARRSGRRKQNQADRYGGSQLTGHRRADRSI